MLGSARIRASRSLISSNAAVAGAWEGHCGSFRFGTMRGPPNPHKALGVKRKYFPRPRGATFFLTPFLRGQSSGGGGAPAATRLAIGGRRDSWPPRPRTSRTQHSCGLRRPSPAGPGGWARDSAPAGPDTQGFPAPWPFEGGGLTSLQGRGQLGTAHGRAGSSAIPPSGAVVRRGSGRPWDGAQAPSPS
jgi:hypothetical protein